MQTKAAGSQLGDDVETGCGRNGIHTFTDVMPRLHGRDALPRSPASWARVRLCEKADVKRARSREKQIIVFLCEQQGGMKTANVCRKQVMTSDVIGVKGHARRGRTAGTQAEDLGGGKRVT